MVTYRLAPEFGVGQSGVSLENCENAPINFVSGHCRKFQQIRSHRIIRQTSYVNPEF